MAIERRFIEENVKNATLDEYLAATLQRAGYGGMDLKRSPLGTRIIVRIERPGLVIGRKGKSIKRLTEQVESEFNMENPQIEVEEIEKPELNANVMASKLADSLEKGVNFRRAAYGTLRRMMEAGARGVEIVISGKITGGRSRSLRFADGYLKKCGNPAIEQVDKGYAVAKKKVGVLGVNVKIMPPDVVLPDEIKFIDTEQEAPQTEEPEPRREKRYQKRSSPQAPRRREKESPPVIDEAKKNPPPKTGPKKPPTSNRPNSTASRHKSSYPKRNQPRPASSKPRSNPSHPTPNQPGKEGAD
jgi:small subunit ribosomal protein S3